MPHTKPPLAQEYRWWAGRSGACWLQCREEDRSGRCRWAALAMAASLRQSCGGGAKGAYPRCAPSCPLQPGSVEDQDYSMVHSKAPTRGGPAQTRRCTGGMDRGCSAMRGMDSDAPLSESPRGWAGRIERRWRLVRHDRKSHRRARDRNPTSRPASLCACQQKQKLVLEPLWRKYQRPAAVPAVRMMLASPEASMDSPRPGRASRWPSPGASASGCMPRRAKHGRAKRVLPFREGGAKRRRGRRGLTQTVQGHTSHSDPCGAPFPKGEDARSGPNRTVPLSRNRERATVTDPRPHAPPARATPSYRHRRALGTTARHRGCGTASPSRSV